MMKLCSFLLLGILSLSSLCADPVTVFNGGIGGHNSRQGNERLSSLLQKIQPQILIIGYGGNDALNSGNLVSPEDFQRNFDAMISSARKQGVKVIMLNTISPAIDSYLSERHRYPDSATPGERVNQYNKLIRDIAARHQLILNDIYLAVEQRGGATEAASSLVRNPANSRTKDGLHLTAAGARLLGELAAEQLKGKVHPGDRVLCLGDSITWGAGLSGAGTSTGETYPAWLQTCLNYQLGLSTAKTPPAYQPPSPMQIPNPDFEKDSPQSVPSGWAADKKTASMEVRRDADGTQYLRLTPQTPNVPAFLRTDLFQAQAGTWLLAFRSRGAGEFQVALSSFRNGGVPEPLTPLSDGWIPQTSEWKTHSFRLSVPSGVRQVSLVVRQRGGSGDFDQWGIAPASLEVPTLPPAATLKGNGITVQFLAPEQGGGISSIRNAEGVEFINRRTAGSLWSVKLKKIHPDVQKLPPVTFLSIDPEQDDGTGGKDADSSAGDDLNISAEEAVRLGARPRISVQEKSVTFFWDGLKVGDRPDTLDVWAKAELSPDGTYCMIDGGFVNRSETHTVFYFNLPQISGLGAIHDNPSGDFLATPFFNGRLIANPLEKGLLGKQRLFQPNRSGHSMQFDVLYNRRSALYLASFDPLQNAKRYQINASRENGLGWALVNIPDNMRRIPQRWDIPYRSGFRTFQGDWYDGCMIYRDWALRQYWCAEGPVSTRKSTPRWFKEIDEWFQLGVDQAQGQRKELQQFIGDTAGGEIGAWISYWGLDNKSFHALNPDRFPFTQADRNAMGFLKEKKVRAMGYLQCTAWSNGSPSFRKQADEANRNLVRNYFGQAIKWHSPATQKTEDLIAYPGQLWRKALGDVVVQMAESGFDAVYLDSGNHGGTYLNFTPACSTESGGGIGYVKGNQTLMADLRDRARKVNPEFCFTSESFWEGNIAHLDGYLVCNTTNAYLEDDRVTAIPMAQAVYHDYTVMYSVWPSRWDVERDNALGYIAKNGLAFCWGVKPGWNILSLLYRYENHQTALDSSLKRYAAYRAAKKFLVYGRMLRPPAIQSAAAKVPVKWHISYSERFFSILMDPVLGNTWQAPDNSCALVLYNITEQEQAVSVDLDRNDFGPGKGRFRALYPAGQSFTEGTGKLGLRVDMKVPPRTPVILEFRKD